MGRSKREARMTTAAVAISTEKPRELLSLVILQSASQPTNQPVIWLQRTQSEPSNYVAACELWDSLAAGGLAACRHSSFLPVWPLLIVAPVMWVAAASSAVCCTHLTPTARMTLWPKVARPAPNGMFNTLSHHEQGGRCMSVSEKMVQVQPARSTTPICQTQRGTN